MTGMMTPGNQFLASGGAREKFTSPSPPETFEPVFRSSPVVVTDEMVERAAKQIVREGYGILINPGPHWSAHLYRARKILEVALNG